MILDDLVEQVKEELRESQCYDMRTFDFIHFDRGQAKSYDTVEFFIYEKPSRKNRQYLCLTYDLFTGQLLYRGTSPTVEKTPKRVLGFERQGRVTLFPV